MTCETGRIRSQSALYQLSYSKSFNSETAMSSGREVIFGDDEMKLIEELAPSLSKEQLAMRLGCCYNTLRAVFQRQPEMLDAYNRSLSTAADRMIKKLYNKGLEEGDFNSIKLWLSQRAGWTEKSRTEITGADGDPLQIDQHWTIEVIE